MKKKVIIVLLLLISAFVIFKISSNKTSTLTGFETNFSVENSEELTRIFISTTGGNVADLKKDKSGTWYINDKYETQKYAIDFILESLEKFKVHSAVPKNGIEGLTKELAARHKKVELYKNNEDTPFKTLYIGTPNQSLSANLAIVETRKHGMADKPYYVMKIGHKGIIGPMFFTKEAEWMTTRIFEYPQLNFKQITIRYPQDTAKSFAVLKQGQEYLVANPNSKLVYNKKNTNNLVLDEYLEKYKKIHFESLNESLVPYQVDSLINTTPIAVISVTPMAGKTDSVQVYQRKGQQYDLDRNMLGTGQDLDYYYGYFQGKVVNLQRFNFDPVLFERSDFITL
ncbi:hypothetical protein [Luteibaculum oceani]|uniref:DUF4340 domain-containing protein n=1 Tax=Luteibaculum oceani TaxID=1294296 RepID=A0A5C6VFB8_9FLAO|nr:hypothetical protein [Luteibaculum oceani]TXC81968.1 hypothetical protein FRX97_02430 [Luteibaculum oceani]